MRHATISAWQRHEEGGYAAEIGGWNLRVEWHPEGSSTFEGKRGFTWHAEREGQKSQSDKLFEEIELAMADAEIRTEAPQEKPSA